MEGWGDGGMGGWGDGGMGGWGDYSLFPIPYSLFPIPYIKYLSRSTPLSYNQMVHRQNWYQIYRLRLLAL